MKLNFRLVMGILFVFSSLSLISAEAINTIYGSLERKANTKIEFFEDGNVKSFIISKKQTAEFLKKYSSDAEFRDGSKIEFYHSGRIKEFTPSISILINEIFNFTTKPKKPIILSETGTILSFIPSDGTIMPLWEGKNIVFYKDKPIEFYENGSFKEITWDFTGINFEFSDIMFCGSPDESVLPLLKGFKNLSKNYIANIKFFENQKIKEILALPDITIYDEMYSYNFFNVLAVDNQLRCVKHIKYNIGGEIDFVEYQDNSFVLSQEILNYSNLGSDTETVYVKKAYYKNGKPLCMTGHKALVIHGTGFSNSFIGCLFIYDNSETYKTIEIDSRYFYNDYEIFFDENKNPLSYSVKDGKNIKKIPIVF